MLAYSMNMEAVYLCDPDSAMPFGSIHRDTLIVDGDIRPWIARTVLVRAHTLFVSPDYNELGWEDRVAPSRRVFVPHAPRLIKQNGIPHMTSRTTQLNTEKLNPLNSSAAFPSIGIYWKASPGKHLLPLAYAGKTVIATRPHRLHAISCHINIIVNSTS